MSWRIEVKPTAEKQYLTLDRPTRSRIRRALRDLEDAERPLQHPRVRGLSGRLAGDYRVRVGAWRILLTPDRASRILRVYAILPRDDAY